jgi:hypothetical protein
MRRATAGGSHPEVRPHIGANPDRRESKHFQDGQWEKSSFFKHENVSIVNLGEDVAVRQVFKPEDTSEPTACFAYHPTKEEMVVATQKSTLIHLNAAGEVVRTFKAHQMPVLCMAYDPYGEF